MAYASSWRTFYPASLFGFVSASSLPSPPFLSSSSSSSSWYCLSFSTSTFSWCTSSLISSTALFLCTRHARSQRQVLSAAASPGTERRREDRQSSYSTVDLHHSIVRPFHFGDFFGLTATSLLWYANRTYIKHFIMCMKNIHLISLIRPRLHIFSR